MMGLVPPSVADTLLQGLAVALPLSVPLGRVSADAMRHSMPRYLSKGLSETFLSF